MIDFIGFSWTIETTYKGVLTGDCARNAKPEYESAAAARGHLVKKSASVQMTSATGATANGGAPISVGEDVVAGTDNHRLRSH